jgi:hypothetical protein
VELSLNTGKLEYLTDSLASQIGFFQYNYLINSSRPTTPSMMARMNLSSGSGYILNQSSGGDDDIKALFFPMALEAMLLQWFDKLNPGSIRGWEDL